MGGGDGIRCVVYAADHCNQVRACIDQWTCIVRRYPAYRHPWDAQRRGIAQHSRTRLARAGLAARGKEGPEGDITGSGGNGILCQRQLVVAGSTDCLLYTSRCV